MNKLLIIGNGFDLAHGLKTSYNDFLLWYLDQAITTFNTDQRYNDGLIEITSLIPIKFNEGGRFLSFKQVFSVFEHPHIKWKGSSNFITNILMSYNSGNWVDIEYAYYRTLLSLFKESPSAPTHETNYYTKAVQKINLSLRLLSEKLNEYLKLYVLGKAERQIAIADAFSEVTGNNYDNQGETREYLPKTLVLNFNYTNTLELYPIELGLSKSTTKLVNIHGQIDSTSNPIVFGYGDEMDKNYPILEDLNINCALDHIKSFHYLKTSSYKQLLSFLESRDPFSVHVMGHSCGISDRVLLNTIFENKYCDNIQIHYYQRSDNTNDFFEKTQEISRQFKNKESMRNKIVSFDKCSPLS